jgi:hypothetical protein
MYPVNLRSSGPLITNLWLETLRASCYALPIKCEQRALTELTNFHSFKQSSQFAKVFLLSIMLCAFACLLCLAHAHAKTPFEATALSNCPTVLVVPFASSDSAYVSTDSGSNNGQAAELEAADDADDFDYDMVADLAFSTPLIWRASSCSDSAWPHWLGSPLREATPPLRPPMA